MDKESCDRLIDQASALLAVSRQLDYLKIIEHDRAEVKKLNTFLGDLDAGVGSVDSAPHDFSGEQNHKVDNAVADDDSVSSTTQHDEIQANRQMAILEQLTIEGFADRLGRVYSSHYEERSMEFRKVTHRKNLPEFDMIVAADFAPGAGVHGIIVTEHHVMSVYLASPEEQNEWEILKRRPYDNMEEMGEYVTLMSAGFDLP